jgi:hypothetical protein
MQNEKEVQQGNRIQRLEFRYKMRSINSFWLLSFRYYTYTLVSINFTDNIRKCHHVMVDGLSFRSGCLENMELICAVSRQVGGPETNEGGLTRF